MPKELRKNEAVFSWRRRRIFTGHGKYVRTPDSNYPKRRAEIITAQNKGCMIRAPCVSKPQHIFFYNWIPPRGRHLRSAGTYDRGSLKTDRRFLYPFTGQAAFAAERSFMEFFNSAIGVLQTLVIALGAGLGIWGVINLLEGYGNDNPGAKSQGIKQFMAN